MIRYYIKQNIVTGLSMYIRYLSHVMFVYLSTLNKNKYIFNKNMPTLRFPPSRFQSWESKGHPQRNEALISGIEGVPLDSHEFLPTATPAWCSTFAQPREFVVAWHIHRPATRPSRNPGDNKNGNLCVVWCLREMDRFDEPET